MADNLPTANDPTKPGPNATSGDYKAMCEYWDMVDAILGGAPAMRSRKYLPKFENESEDDFNHRVGSAPFTDIYTDISVNLASKPFSRELKLKDDAGQDFKRLAEDVDGQGNNLHNFASTLFSRGIDYSVDWIFVDYTKTPAGTGTRPLTVNDEKALGARPYWVHVPAGRMLAVYSDRENAQEVFVHARISEPMVVRSGFGEVTVNRVRVLNREKGADDKYAPATAEVFEERTDDKGQRAWVSVEGPTLITVGVVPIVPFYTGKRMGTSWQFRPPLRSVAFMQVSAFQQESNLATVLEAAAYPVLAGNGIANPGADTRIPVGPRSVLFAPPNNDGGHGEWKFIEPSGESIKALETRLEATQRNMRDLGMQPLTTANLTVITTANLSLKAHSAVQAWALRLKDSLEQAWKYTAMWLRQEANAPEVDVYQDFGVDMEAGTELDSLLKAQAQGVISKRTTQEEFQRRSVLSDNFSADDEELRLAEEHQGVDAETAMDPVTGELVEPSTRPVVVGNPTRPTVPPVVPRTVQ